MTTQKIFEVEDINLQQGDTNFGNENKKRSYEDRIDSEDINNENESKRRKENDELGCDETITVIKKPKKKVCWFPDDQLEQIKIFEKEQSVTGKDFRTVTNDVVSERAQYYVKKMKEEDEWRLKKNNMQATIPWRTPPSLDFEGDKGTNSLNLLKKETPEQKSQIEREESTLMAIYFSELDIPFSPAEPDKKNSHPTYDDVGIKSIPADLYQQQPQPILNHLNINQLIQPFVSPQNLFNPQQPYLQNQNFNIPMMQGNPNIPQQFYDPMAQSSFMPRNFNNIPQMDIKPEIIRYGDYNIIKTLYNINQIGSSKDLKKFECRFFPKGQCHYGNSCKYLHLEPAQGMR